METDPKVLVLGIGNLLWADEGFGVRAVEDFHRHYEVPANVKIMDGGTQGIYLVQHVREADILVVFDAVDYSLPPGTMKCVEDRDVPNFLGVKKISLHQTGFQEVLAMADMLGDYPKHILLIGVQPVELDDFGGSLRDEVKKQIAPAIDVALGYLKKFNITVTKRTAPLSETDTIACKVMRLQAYENNRPTVDDACRTGDARVIGDDSWIGPKDYDQEIDQILSQDHEDRR